MTDDYAVQLLTLPAAPLQAFLRDRMAASSRVSVYTHLRMSAGTFHKLLHQNRVKFFTADKVCNRLGIHPVQLWPEEWILCWEPTYTNSTTLTHCTNGHPMTIDHAVLQPNGQRKCQTCQRASSARYNTLRKLAA